ncbi:hypothetical protein JRQ81_014320 [Phrynocephalus forsythii]|uniref:Uncharacterized protein n=1 Tax=Phrynocephalus forsythii TaxID=171643 RepID=A0A9Q0XYE1_9SAUR|nr:hypothetical protein JRQ81_014320 [Phrynocephalus forsythii]
MTRLGHIAYKPVFQSKTESPAHLAHGHIGRKISVEKHVGQNNERWKGTFAEEDGGCLQTPCNWKSPEAKAEAAQEERRNHPEDLWRSKRFHPYFKEEPDPLRASSEVSPAEFNRRRTASKEVWL